MTSSVITGAIMFASSQLVLLLLLLLRRAGSWSTSERLLCLFLITVLAYVVRPLVPMGLADSGLTIVENFLPGVFWLFCSNLFVDHFRMRAWSISLVLATVLIPLIGKLLVDAGWQLPKLLYSTLPQALEFGLLAAALFAVVRFWKTDLVEMRRKLRLWFCAVAGVYIFILIMMRELLFQGAAWLEVWQYLPVGLICLITNVLLLQMTPGIISPMTERSALSHKSKAASPSTIDVPQAVIEQLDVLMLEQHAYREMGLTIGELADRLQVPEYRLRKFINAGLGYRNFNDYLNGFRIKEAGERLMNPEQAPVAILTIALETGFRSLSSFNKAFREAYGKTPSEFRKHFSGEATSSAI